MKHILLPAALLLTAVFCGCAKDKTAPEPMEKAAEMPDEAAVTALFDALDEIDRLGGCAVKTDHAKTVEIDGYEYAVVTDERYQTEEDIRALTEASLTEELQNGRYGDLLDGEPPLYVGRDDTLYVLEAGRGCGFPYTGAVRIISCAKDTVKAEREFDNYGGTSSLCVTLTVEDGTWKVDSFTIEDAE